MKFLLASDCHFTSLQPVCRSDDILPASVNKWRDILQLAKKHSATVLLAGDFCDRPRDWYLLPKLMAVCAELKEVPIYAVFGQHDMYMRSEERHATILGIMAQAGMIKVITKKGTWFGAKKPEKPWCVHGCHWGENIPQVNRDNLDQRYEPKHALVIHAPIAKEEIYPGHNYQHVNDLFSEYPDYDLIVCGDVHRRFIAVGPKKQLAVNTGPIMRLEADEYMMQHKPAVMLFDTLTKRYEWHNLNVPASKDVLSRDHIQAKEERKKLLDSFVASIDHSSNICRAQMADRLADWVEANERRYPEVVRLLAEVCALPRV